MRADTTRFLNDRPDWNLLRTYLALMQERSLSRAAARLHVTQPAVSHALRRLEDALGRKLIERRGAQFVPAEAENSAPKKRSSRPRTSFSFVSFSWLNGMCQSRSTSASGRISGLAGLMPGRKASPRAMRTTWSG